jgi:hypothetical protein
MTVLTVWAFAGPDKAPAAEIGDTILIGNNLLHRNRNIRLI